METLRRWKQIIFKRRIVEKQLRQENAEAYAQWLKKHPSRQSAAGTGHPKIAVLGAANTPEQANQLVRQMLGQTYTHWVLLIASAHAKQIQDGWQDDERVCCVRPETPLQMLEKWNCCEWILILRMEMVLEPDALEFAMAELAVMPYADGAYADEDHIDSRGVRSEPWFKPDWSPDAAATSYFPGSFVLLRRSIVDALCHGTTLRQAIQTQWSEALSKQDLNMRHIADVLCHERKRAVGRWRLRKARRAEERSDASNAKVSIVILSKDHPDMLSRCVQSIHRTTESQRYEILVVDNGSSEKARERYLACAKRQHFRYMYHPAPFNFSALCNVGAKATDGQLLLFLNDDILCVCRGWLEAMACHALRPGIGAVGAKLLRTDRRTVQHAGIVIGDYGPVNWGDGMHRSLKTPGRQMRGDHNFLAVTGACLMMRRQVFNELGGFDECYANNYNDVDLCLRAYQKGMRNVCKMDKPLIHCESVTRGKICQSPETQKKTEQERAQLRNGREEIFERDPYLNVNLRRDRVWSVTDARRWAR